MCDRQLNEFCRGLATEVDRIVTELLASRTAEGAPALAMVDPHSVGQWCYEGW